MNSLYEYSDILNSPIEAFYCEAPTFHLPVEAHWHYFVELIYVYEGCATVSCNEHIYTLTSDTLIIIPPQAIHSIDKAPDSATCRYACIKFNVNRIHLVENYIPNLNFALRKIAQIPNPPLSFRQDDFKHFNLSDFFEEMVYESEKRYYGYNSYLYTRLSSLLLKLLRIWYYKGYTLQTESVVEQDEYSIQEALIYIDSHSNENINIEQLAHKCNMSYSYFAKVFKKQYGQSCSQYIDFIRLAKAESLLLFTDMDLTSIASETGFADCSHLIRCFRRRYNITPKQFRLKHKGATPL